MHFYAKRFGANYIFAYLCTDESKEGFRTTAELFSFCLS